jgi:outer membrane protein assembly factor BamE
MRPARPNPVPRRLALTLAALSMLLAGCVYRMDIQQGNYLDGHDVRQLKVGMTRAQVRYLLGTPMIKDVFDHDRWDYVYYFKRGYVHKPIESRVTVFFHGDKVSSFKLYDVPKGSPLAPGLLPSVDKFPI